MKFPPVSTRHLTLLLALAASVAASLLVRQQEQGGEQAASVVEAVRYVGATSTPDASERASLQTISEAEGASSASTLADALDSMQRAQEPPGQTNPFGFHSWYVAPPPPPPQKIAPTVPTAPPFPLTYLGKIELAGGKWIAHFAKGEDYVAVRPGETFEGVYRLEGVEQNQLVVMYLPLSIKQYLPLPDASS